jgi:hypothetical protein
MLWEAMFNAAEKGHLDILQWAIQVEMTNRECITRYIIVRLIEYAISGRHSHIIRYLITEFDRVSHGEEDDDEYFTHYLDDVPEDWDEIVDLLLERHITMAAHVLIWAIPLSKQSLFNRLKSSIQHDQWIEIYNASASEYYDKAKEDVVAQSLLVDIAQRCHFMTCFTCFFTPCALEVYRLQPVFSVGQSCASVLV